eukprot:2351170-Pyramimonas_sp.AAC.1
MATQAIARQDEACDVGICHARCSAGLGDARLARWATQVHVTQGAGSHIRWASPRARLEWRQFGSPLSRFV